MTDDIVEKWKAENLTRPDCVDAGEGHPRCPGCGTRPLTFAARGVQFPNGQGAMVFFCAVPQCGTTLSVVPVQGRVQPALVVPR